MFGIGKLAAANATLTTNLITLASTVETVNAGIRFDRQKSSLLAASVPGVAGLIETFGSLLLIHKDKFWFAITGVITFASLMTFTLYSWLLTPLEDAH